MLVLCGIHALNVTSIKLKWSSTEQLDLSYASILDLAMSPRPMIKQLGWATLKQHRLLSQLNLFYKIQQGLVGISLPPEVCPLDRTSRLPNVSPYRHIQSNCDIYKYSFYPRSIVMWNQLPIRNLPLSNFQSTIMPTIKSMV